MFSWKNGEWSFRLVVIALYLLLTVAIVQTVLVLFLYATRSVDATACASLILAFVSSQCSLIYIVTHAFLARRARTTGLRCLSRRSSLDSVCRCIPRILIILWMATAAVGIIVAARQPTCLSGTPGQNFWQIGRSCRLHRAIVAMTLVALIAICVVFSSIEVSKQPYHASLFGIIESGQDDGSVAPSRSVSSANSLVREKKAAMAPSVDLEAPTSDWAVWLQRRNSVSTQSAVYPPCLRGGPHPGLTGSPFPQDRPWTGAPSPAFSCPSRAVSTTSTRTPSPSDLSMFRGHHGPGRAPSTVSSTSRSSSTTSTRRSPLSTMRRVSEPEVPIIPPQFLDPPRSPPLQRRPTLPCSWSPTLSHAPLSADPAIRAFSSESTQSLPTASTIPTTSKVAPRTVARPKKSTNGGIRIVRPSQSTEDGFPPASASPEAAPDQHRPQSVKEQHSQNVIAANDSLPPLAPAPRGSQITHLNIRKKRRTLDIPHRRSKNRVSLTSFEPAQPIKTLQIPASNDSVRSQRCHPPFPAVAAQDTAGVRWTEKWWKLAKNR